MAGRAHGQARSPDRVVLFEDGFPTADTAPPSLPALQEALPGAAFVTAKDLPAHLARRTTRLLVLPFGSAFPEPAWPSIQAFLGRGGNLLVIGGKPFTRAAYREQAGWRLRPESTRFIRELLVDQYQTTPGSAGLTFEPNPDSELVLAPFPWTRAFSPLVHLSARDLYNRDGATGARDARLDTLAWGTKDRRRLAAPVLRIDHLQARFAGGRWILIAAELPQPAPAPLIAQLAEAAARGSEDFTVRPRLPLYQAGETVELDLRWQGAARGGKVEITVTPPSGPPVARLRAALPARRVSFPAPAGRGLFTVEARLSVAGSLRAVYRAGFWMRDRERLRSGPRLSIDRDYFQVDGRPLAVMGTTHMASDVQRLFFEHPNVFVWDRDLAGLAESGINMLRTGWWTAWDKVCDRAGRPHQRTLRTLEAYLMTAQQYRLPVQFTFFAFLPEVLGGGNPYLEALALRRQRALVGTLVETFADVPFLAWDLINEPSFSRRLWSDRPGGDALERARWNAWLKERYPDRTALAARWQRPLLDADLPVPDDAAFDPRATHSGRGALDVYDWRLFAQETFAGWVKQLRQVIRAAGSSQLVTVGQDEGGLLGRPSPAFFGPAVDFTTNHSWWQNDALLWDSLAAKQPGRPMLIQETGYQRELNLDHQARRDPRSEAELVARKLALSFVGGAGAIQWLWHTNAYMTSGNEVSIGAVRADGTEKPEAAVMRELARFAAALGPHLRDPRPPPVALMASQAAQLSVLRDLAIEAQQSALRALSYDLHQPAAIVAENQLDQLGRPALTIVPAAQALTDEGWRALLAYAEGGGTLLVTGALDRDEHWRRAVRVSALFPGAASAPLVHREAALRLPGGATPVSFAARSQSWLEVVRFPDGGGLHERALGKGHLFWSSLPVELAESREAARALYAHVLHRVGILPPGEVSAPPAVLVHATLLADAILYVLVSERDEPAKLAITDRTTRARLALELPAGGIALALLRRSDGAVLARHGF